jgi:hypothetical protein
MSHFAKIDSNKKVVNIIVAEEDFFTNFIDNEPGEWIQVSYNTRAGKHFSSLTNEEDDGVPLRGNYPQIGFTYNNALDAFVAPQPYSSWTLNETSYLWEAPTAYPDDGNTYTWDEETTAWVLVE